MEQLRIENLSKTYGTKEVVKGISYQVSHGEIVGLLGANGAGKSTTIRLITGLEDITEGRILYEGAEITKGKEQNQKARNQKEQYLRKLGVVPQELALYEDMSGYDNVSFFCSLYGYKGKELKNRVREALEFVGLWERSKEAAKHYSGGMKRRLNIACSIAHRPELLIMDEPTVGIDPQSRNHIMETIRKLNQRGTTVIYVSHYMEEVEQLCGRIIIMEEGRLLEDCGKTELKEKYKDKNLNTLEEIFLYLTGKELRDEEV